MTRELAQPRLCLLYPRLGAALTWMGLALGGPGCGSMAPETEPVSPHSESPATPPRLLVGQGAWETALVQVSLRDVGFGHHVYVLDRPTACADIEALVLQPPTVMGVGWLAPDATQASLTLSGYDDLGQTVDLDLSISLTVATPAHAGLAKVTVSAGEGSEGVVFPVQHCPRPQAESAEQAAERRAALQDICGCETSRCVEDGQTLYGDRFDAMDRQTVAMCTRAVRARTAIEEMPLLQGLMDELGGALATGGLADAASTIGGLGAVQAEPFQPPVGPLPTLVEEVERCGPVLHKPPLDGLKEPRVFFERGGNLCSLRPDGTDMRLEMKGFASLHVESTLLSSDRTRLGWLTPGGELLQVDLSARRIERVGSLGMHPDLYMRIAGWSPDGAHMVVSVERIGGTSSTDHPTPLGAHVFDLSSGEHRVKALEGRVVGFADDASLVVVQSGDEPFRDRLVRWTLDGDTSTTLVVAESVQHVLAAVVAGPWVYYLGEEAEDGLLLGVVRPDGSEHRVVHRYEAAPRSMAWSLAGSVDGTRVAAFSGLRGEEWLEFWGLDGASSGRMPGHAGAAISWLGGSHVLSGLNRTVVTREVGETHGRLIARDVYPIPVE